MPCDAYIALLVQLSNIISWHNQRRPLIRGMAWSQNAHTLANASKGCWGDLKSHQKSTWTCPYHSQDGKAPFIRAIKIQVWYVHKFSRTCFFLAYCCMGSLMMFDAVSQFSPSLLNWTSRGSHDFDLIRHHFHTMANLCVGHPYWAAPSMLQPATAPKHKANWCASQTCGWTPSNNPSFFSRHTVIHPLFLLFANMSSACVMCGEQPRLSVRNTEEVTRTILCQELKTWHEHGLRDMNARNTFLKIGKVGLSAPHWIIRKGCKPAHTSQPMLKHTSYSSYRLIDLWLIMRWASAELFISWVTHHRACHIERTIHLATSEAKRDVKCRASFNKITYSSLPWLYAAMVATTVSRTRWINKLRFYEMQFPVPQTSLWARQSDGNLLLAVLARRAPICSPHTWNN